MALIPDQSDAVPDTGVMSNWWPDLLQWLLGVVRHSILSPEWWGNVLQGSLGSLIALAGVLLLIKHERTRDRNAHAIEARKRELEEKRLADQKAAEDQRAANERAYESFMSLNETCSRVMLGVPKEDRPAIQVADSLFHFSIREVPDCPPLHRWIKKHQHYLLVSTTQEKEAKIAGSAAGTISGVLSAWMIEGRPAKFFSRNSADPDSAWRKICVEQELEPFPTLEEYEKTRDSEVSSASVSEAR